MICGSDILKNFRTTGQEGETEEELKEHLIDIYKELTSSNIPNVRRIAELEIS